MPAKQRVGCSVLREAVINHKPSQLKHCVSIVIMNIGHYIKSQLKHCVNVVINAPKLFDKFELSFLIRRNGEGGHNHNILK